MYGMPAASIGRQRLGVHSRCYMRVHSVSQGPTGYQSARGLYERKHIGVRRLDRSSECAAEERCQHLTGGGRQTGIAWVRRVITSGAWGTSLQEKTGRCGVRTNSRKLTIIHLIISLLALSSVSRAIAVEIVDEKKDVARVVQVGPVSVIYLPNGTQYTPITVPPMVKSFKAFIQVPPEFQKEKYKKGLASLSLGNQMTREEVVAVLDAYLREVALDFDSVKLRKLQVGDRQYIAWCDNYLFTCLNWQFRAGTPVNFEMNAKNRNGGMTGFDQNIVLIRKLEGTVRANDIQNMSAVESQQEAK
jgi:hypothetical protein